MNVANHYFQPTLGHASNSPEVSNEIIPDDYELLPLFFASSEESEELRRFEKPSAPVAGRRGVCNLCLGPL